LQRKSDFFLAQHYFRSSATAHRVFLLPFAFILFSSAYRNCAAQVVDPLTAAQAPVPGAGHHYIGAGAETVNPADGSVTFDLPIRTPSGRMLSFPLGIRYHNSDAFYLSNSGGIGPAFSWTTPKLNGTQAPFELNGWSYDLPNYEANAYVISSSPVSGGCGDPDGNPCAGHNTNYCFAGQNYGFKGFDGLQHPFEVFNQWPDPDNPQSGAAFSCNGGNISGFDYGVTATLGALGSATQPNLEVTDRSGTIYQFAQEPTISTNPAVVTGGVTPFGALASSITDRNGNQILLNGAGAYSFGSVLSSGSYRDTLGRTVLSWSGLGNPAGDTISISGLSKAIVVKWTMTTVTFPTNFQVIFNGTAIGPECSLEASSRSIAVVSEIDLPNGQKYSFTYGDKWGLLSKITFPGGGYVRYGWGTDSLSQATYQVWKNGQSAGTCSAIVDTPAITDRYVSYDGSSEILTQQFSYSTTWAENPSGLPYWTSKATTVSSSDTVSGSSTNTLYTYANLGINDYGNGVPVEQKIIYQDGSGNTLKTVNKTWYDRYTMIGEQAILNSGQGMTTLQCPDFPNERILATYQYNSQSAGSKPTDPACSLVAQSIPASSSNTLSSGLNTAAIGPLLLSTATEYHNFGTTNIVDEPDTITEYDGSGNQVKQTSYLYDKSTPATSGAKTGLVSPPGSRGNATSVQQLLNTNNSLLTTSYAYYDTGQVQSVTDPCGNGTCSDMASSSTHTTTYSYTDSPLGGNSAGQSNAYLTTMTRPSTNGTAHTTSYQYNYPTGELSQSADENSQPTTYSYADPLLRLTDAYGPPSPQNGNANPHTHYAYNDNLYVLRASPSVTTTGPTGVTSVSLMDGMEHIVGNKLTTDPVAADYVDTVYDGLGRVHSVSNPYRATSDSTYGLTTYSYDALNRKTLQTQPDGSMAQWCYNGLGSSGPGNCLSNRSSQASTSWVDYSDENGNHWQRASDGLGRLVSVIEPIAGETDYSYNALDDLLTVTQKGVAGAEAARSRSFTYDSLGRLLTASNPETGTVCYGTWSGGSIGSGSCQNGYDLNGNLIAKTDARGVTISYAYDALNRLLWKSYANDSSGTPTSCYQYDGAASSNLVGRLVNEWTQAGSCPSAVPSSGFFTLRSISAYDPMGRIQSEQQCTPSKCTTSSGPSLSYGYDLAGNATSLTNSVGASGSPLTLTYGYDTAAHLKSVTSGWAAFPTGLYSLPTGGYGPIGPLNWSLGPDLSVTQSSTNRLWVNSITATGQVP
jgi:YD repeat-containing protein